MADIIIADCTDPTLPEVLSQLHIASFVKGWNANAFLGLLSTGGMRVLLASKNHSQAVGFILLRIAADEAEVITLAVHPRHRGAGIGLALVQDALAECKNHQVQQVYLEVSKANQAAINLYKKAGFLHSGTRVGYYRITQDVVEDALLMQRDLA